MRDVKITAKYAGAIVTGVVEMTEIRCRKIVHVVKLDKPIRFSWSTKDVYKVLIEPKFVIEAE